MDATQCVPGAPGSCNLCAVTEVSLWWGPHHSQGCILGLRWLSHIFKVLVFSRHVSWQTSDKNEKCGDHTEFSVLLLGELCRGMGSVLFAFTKFSLVVSRTSSELYPSEISPWVTAISFLLKKIKAALAGSQRAFPEVQIKTYRPLVATHESTKINDIP